LFQHTIDNTFWSLTTFNTIGGDDPELVRNFLTKILWSQRDHKLALHVTDLIVSRETDISKRERWDAGPERFCAMFSRSPAKNEARAPKGFVPLEQLFRGMSTNLKFSVLLKNIYDCFVSTSIACAKM
jgi:hypothetical protein